jgi:hypothetical protein
MQFNTSLVTLAVFFAVRAFAASTPVQRDVGSAQNLKRRISDPGSPAKLAHDVHPYHARYMNLNRRQAATLSVSLASTNPTAVPLSAIGPSESPKATEALNPTPTAGSVPSYLPGASGLPNGMFTLSFTSEYLLFILRQ